jgi:hypothetical protein
MHAVVVQGSTPYAITALVGLLMLRIASTKQQVESKYRARWCASCHRRFNGPSCACGRER